VVLKEEHFKALNLASLAEAEVSPGPKPSELVQIKLQQSGQARHDAKPCRKSWPYGYLYPSGWV